MNTESVPVQILTTRAGLRASRKSAGVSRGAGLKFFLPAAIQKAVPFIVLPLITSLVSPDAYGQMIILTTVMLLGTTVFSFGLDTTIFYAAHRGSPSNIRANFGNAARLLLLLPVTFGIIFSALAMVGFFSFSKLDTLPLAISILSSGLFVAGNVFATSMYRLSFSLWSYGFTIIGYSLVQQATKLLLIQSGFEPVLSWSLGDLAGGLFLLVLAIPILVSSVRTTSTSRFRMCKLLKRGLPLVPSRIAQWTLQMSDRALIVGILGTSSGGIYGLAAQLGSLSAIFVIELCRFMLPNLARAGGEGVGTVWVRRTLPIQFVASALMASGVAFCGPILIGLLFHEDYALGATLIPAIAASACIAGWFYSVTDFVGVTLGKTGKLWIFTVVGSVSSVVLNLVFLSRFGLIAAALSSVASYAFMLSWVIFYARKELKAYGAWTLRTSMYSVLALILILASIPFASSDNYALTAVGLAVTCVPGLLVLASHHRSRSSVEGY